MMNPRSLEARKAHQQTRRRKPLVAGSRSSTVIDFTSLDETMWGTLQNHIDLARHVYSKLPPLQDFFNLRTVCKAWYNVACERLVLQDPRCLRKPFFALYTKGAHGRLDGILTYNNASNSWNWTRSPVNYESQLVSTDSVVYRLMTSQLYDWKYRRSVSLPPPPVRINPNAKTMVGMSVSTQGENGFKIVLGSREFDTQVYDSTTKRWEAKPCRPTMVRDAQESTGCVECNGCLHITTKHQRQISVYNLETARWSSIKSPLKWIALRNVKKRQHACLDRLGAWEGRVFDVTVSSPSSEYYDLHVGASQSVGRLTVWELVDEEWRRFDCMPKATYAWLRSTKGFRRVSNWKTRVGHVVIHASFCSEFVLVYSWNYSLGEAGRFCLYDMGSKNWHKLRIPAGKVDVPGVHDDGDDEESVLSRNFWSGFGYSRSELLDPEDERYFTYAGEDMSDSELDVFLEENGYDSSHSTSEEFDSDDDMQRKPRKPLLGSLEDFGGSDVEFPHLQERG